MVEKNTSYKPVLALSQICFKLSKKNYEINKSHMQQEKLRLLKTVDCANMEDYFSKLKKILVDNAYLNDLLRGRESIANAEHVDIFKLNKEISVEHYRILSMLQKLYSFYLLEKEIFEKKIFLPPFKDNRGRQYYGSSISPTFYKLFRNLYEFFDEKEFKDLKNSIFYKKILEHSKEVEKFSLNDFQSYIAVVLFIEVGKVFIKKGELSVFKTESIISCGILNYGNRSLPVKFEEAIYLEKIYSTIDDLIERKEVSKNTLIFKDATASGLQNYGVLLGYKREKLRYLNLDSGDWCDTYQYVIEKFLKDTDLRKRKY